MDTYYGYKYIYVILMLYGSWLYMLTKLGTELRNAYINRYLLILFNIQNEILVTSFKLQIIIK